MIEILVISLISFLILCGTFFAVVATVGVIRLPDIYSRLHAASKSSTLGVMMLMLGTFFYFWYMENLIDAKLFLAIIFIFVTAPVAAHVLSRSAFHSDIEPYRLTILNELKRDESGIEEVDYTAPSYQALKKSNDE